jgi:hypothetical protein
MALFARGELHPLPPPLGETMAGSFTPPELPAPARPATSAVVLLPLLPVLLRLLLPPWLAARSSASEASALAICDIGIAFL